MTRKKYDRDYEGEALQYAYGNDDTESEEEEEEVDDYDPWDDIQYYIDSELSFGTNADWIGKWFDATDIIKIIVAFSFQHLSNFPTTKYDEKVDYIITDERVLKT